MTIGEQIKARRKKLGISVPKLAKIIAVPPERIYKWEKGTTPSLLEDHAKIDDFLNGKLEGVSIVEEPQADYKTKYIELLERTLQDKEQKIRELEHRDGVSTDQKKASA